ncbi:MAG: manganese efflux pump MntP family protein [Anaeroplasmataceae bacterium]
MGVLEIIIIAIGLSMDAFAVSICKGISVKKFTIRIALICGIWFGVFQGLMPLIGYYLGGTFEKYISNYDHWIAFGLLFILGLKMVIGSFKKKEIEEECNPTAFKSMFILAVATSIDALAVGITFSLFDMNILVACLSIGIITLVLSMLGTFIGFKFGSKFKNKAEFIGGIILIFMGSQILIQHLFF